MTEAKTRLASNNKYLAQLMERIMTNTMPFYFPWLFHVLQGFSSPEVGLPVGGVPVSQWLLLVENPALAISQRFVVNLSFSFETFQLEMIAKRGQLSSLSHLATSLSFCLELPIPAVSYDQSRNETGWHNLYERCCSQQLHADAHFGRHNPSI